MTTSISNVSAKAEMRDRRVTPPSRATRGPRSLAEGEPTAANSLLFFTLCLVIVLSALAYGTVHYWALAIFQAMAALVVVSWAADAWLSGSLRLSRNVLQLPLLGLILIGLVQLLPLGGVPDTGGAITGTLSRSLSLDPYATRLVLVQLVALLIYFAALLAYTDSPRRLRLLVWTVIIFGFALGFFGIIQSLISPAKIYGLLEPKFAVPFGPFVNRHNFASYMEMAVALPLGLLFSGAVEREKRLLYITACALMGIALLMSGSRGGMVSFIAMIFFLVAVTALKPHQDEGELEAEDARRTQQLILRGGMAFALLVAVIVGVTLIGGESSLTRFVDTVNANDPSTGRTQIWRVTLDVIRAHPLIGTGLGAYGVAYTPFDPNNGVDRAEQAHNDYLQVISDAGIPGAALGLFFLVALFRMGFARRRGEDLFRRGVATGALAGCFAALVHSFFDFTLHTTSNGLLFLTLVVLATVNGRVEKPVQRSRRKRRRRSGARTPVAGQAEVENFEMKDETFTRWWRATGHDAQEEDEEDVGEE